MTYRIFIQTNAKQLLGAKVAAYALRKNSVHADRFDIEILHTDDFPFLAAHEGQEYLRDGIIRLWKNDDLQSFTPLRFVPPERMSYSGRALVIDPDIFAVADVWDLLSLDMGGSAFMCRRRDGIKGLFGYYASSVMLLDCAKLAHWHCQTQFEALFAKKIDYMDWVSLKLEPKESIGFFQKEWNDFDRLTSETKMLHNTRRRTQPWKTGLPIDFSPPDSFGPFPPYGWFMRLKRDLVGEHVFSKTYSPHPDKNQEALFFRLLGECLTAGLVSEKELDDEMEKNHIRHDAPQVIREVLATAA